MASKLAVSFFEGVQSNSSMETISQRLDREEKKSLAFAPWKGGARQPVVSFTAGHTNDSVLLKYYVAEEFLAAAHGATNAPVYNDSCVEFFISFDESGYYNFEFNCLGTCLAAFGRGREGRTLLPVQRIAAIRSHSVIDRNGLGQGINWTITLVLPLSVFTFHCLSSLSGLECRANFFKCGDGLPQPHFVAWANIEAPVPDFHLPRYFGFLAFR